ncbi:MAG: hypothetical protein Q8Q26_01635, partial [Pseudorhodobacter sp.]|nr:hypothetical protein [Pseudorhodobacter sp.]
ATHHARPATEAHLDAAQDPAGFGVNDVPQADSGIRWPDRLRRGGVMGCVIVGSDPCGLFRHLRGCRRFAPALHPSQATPPPPAV